jgi:hypothetical protein
MHPQRFLHNGLEIGHILAFLESDVMANLSLTLPLVYLLTQCLKGLWVLEHVVQDCRETDGCSI